MIYFREEVNKGVNPDEVASFGEVVQGGILSGEGREETKASLFKRTSTPPNASLGDYQFVDSYHILKQARTIWQSGMRNYVHKMTFPRLLHGL